MQEGKEERGDVDHFSLTADQSGLTVNAKWLEYLQVRFLGYRTPVHSCNPFLSLCMLRRVPHVLHDLAEFSKGIACLPNEQKHLLNEGGSVRRLHGGDYSPRLGVLEWVYGSILPTPDKPRDGAHRPLGTS